MFVWTVTRGESHGTPNMSQPAQVVLKEALGNNLLLEVSPAPTTTALRLGRVAELKTRHGMNFPIGSSLEFPSSPKVFGIEH